MFSKIRRELLIPWNNAGIYTIVAGGYVRDIYNNKPYRDIDILININEYSILCRFPFDEPVHIIDTKRSYSNFNNIVTFNYKKWNIELLITSENTTFDLLNKTVRNGLCLCGIDYKEEWYSDIFLKDIKDQQMTLLSFDNIEKSINHWKKLQEKYPWPLRLP